MAKRIRILFILCCLLCLTVSAKAADKTWSGSGDASTWSDDSNWSPSSAPTSESDVLIDTSNASVTCDQTYKAKSITIGGRQTSTLTSNNFIFGTISPASASGTAISNRSRGKFISKGAGAIKVQGQYLDTEGALTSEKSFIFWVK